MARMRSSAVLLVVGGSALVLAATVWVARPWVPVPPPRTQLVEYVPLRGPLRFPPSVDSASPAVRELYVFAARRPDVLRYLPCFCGCTNAGHRSNYDCFIDEVRSDGAVVIDEMGFT